MSGRRPASAALAGLLLALAACENVAVSRVVPIDTGPRLADGAFDLPFPGDCEALCLKALSIPADRFRECHEGAAPDGAGVWCTFEEPAPQPSGF